MGKTVILEDPQSFDIDTETISSDYSLGSLYFSKVTGTASFWSNNAVQTGVGVIGDDNAIPLDELNVSILGQVGYPGDPSAGFWTKHEVPVVVGRAYYCFMDSSLSDYFVFRVTAVGASSVTIDYYSPEAEFSDEWKLDNYLWRYDRFDNSHPSAASLVVDSSGDRLIALFDDGLKLLRIGNAGVRTTEIIDSDAGSGSFTMALNESGFPCVAYNKGRTLGYAEYNGNTWLLSTIDNAQLDYHHCSLDFNNQGHPGVAYFDDDEEDLYFIEFDGSQWNKTLVDEAGSVGKHCSFSFSSEGRPIIAYYDWISDSSGALKIAEYDGSAWQLSAIGDATHAGISTSIIHLPDGRPAVAYGDWGPGVLKYAVRNNQSWDVTTLDRLGLYLFYYSCSLKITPAGYPAISYYDTGDLKYALFDGSNWKLTTVASLGTVGKNNSLAFTGEGNPIVVFYNETVDRWEFAELTGEIDPPSTLSFTSELVPEHTELETQVGIFSGADVSPVERLSFTLFDKENFPDNNKFYIAGNQLFLKESLDFETSKQHEIRVSVTDMTRQSIEESFVIQVGDQNDWEYEVVLDNSIDQHTKIVLNSEGKLCFVYTDNSGIHYAEKVNGTWLITLIYNNSLSGRVGFDFSPEGEPVVSFGTTSGMRYAIRQNGVWNVELIQERGTLTQIGTSSVVKFDSKGVPHVVYGQSEGDYLPRAGKLRYAVREGNDWSIRNVDTMGTDSNSIPFRPLELDFTEEGIPVALYWRSTKSYDSIFKSAILVEDAWVLEELNQPDGNIILNASYNDGQEKWIFETRTYYEEDLDYAFETSSDAVAFRGLLLESNTSYYPLYFAEYISGEWVLDRPLKNIGNDSAVPFTYYSEKEGRLILFYHAITQQLMIARLLIEDSDLDGLLDSWEWLYFGDLTQSGDDDYDGDGLNNWLEEHFYSDPLDPTSGISFVMSIKGGEFCFRVSPLVSESGIELLWSSDMENWTLVDGIEFNIFEDYLNIRILKNQLDPNSYDKSFFRIKVAQ